MNLLALAVAFSTAVSMTGGDVRATTLTFTKEHVGKLPSAWKSARTGKGEGSVWTVVADATAPAKTGFALAQTATSPRAMFNLCVTDAVKAADVEISVAFKAVEGKIDQGGGIVWRYQDADNYYVARLNPLEDNYRLYKVVKGQRVQLATAEDITVPEGSWQRLTIRHVGKKIACLLNGKKILEAEDDAIAAAGLCGLWTKADARTRFDEVVIRDLSRKE